MKKPSCKLVGQNGNIFNPIGIASRLKYLCILKGNRLDLSAGSTGKGVIDLLKARNCQVY